MKGIVYILAIATIYCLQPSTQTHRYKVPKAQRTEIFKVLGLKFNETLGRFCYEVKKVLEKKAGIAISNATEIKIKEDKNSSRTISFTKCLTKNEEEKILFENGFVCLQKKRSKLNGTNSTETVNCTKLEYRLECCKKTVNAECEDYFDDYSSFKCAYCFSQGLSHPCNVLDEYKDLYYKSKETLKKIDFNRTFYNETKNRTYLDQDQKQKEISLLNINIILPIGITL